MDTTVEVATVAQVANVADVAQAGEVATAANEGSARDGAGQGTAGRGRHGGVRPWLLLFLGISGGAVAIAVVLGLLVVATTAAAQAQTATGLGAAATTANAEAGADAAAGAIAQQILQRLQSHQGSGMILVGRDGSLAAPLQSTEALLRVTGNTVRGTVKQRFRNPGEEWLEGTYLFPLPDDAAVDHLRMRIGDKVIEGQIREKEAARREFAAARRQGQRASLVEQKRPNAFSTHVTNIAPGAVIEIELEYQQTLALRDGAWRLRFPGVVAPRYSSPADHQAGAAAARDESRPRDDGQRRSDDGRTEFVQLDEGGSRLAADPAWQAPRMRQGILLAGDFAGLVEVDSLLEAGSYELATDGDMYQPLVPEDLPPLNPIRITVEIDAGVPVVQPVSPSHRLALVSSIGDGNAARIRYRLQTIAGDEAHEVADRDFVLEWSPAAQSLPMATMRHERRGDTHYGIIVINPPSPAQSDVARLPRELTFVVDTSGSMGGESIEQARSALAFGLQRLQADDRFNIIQFNSAHSSLFPAPVAASAANLQAARRHVAGLRADGGTEMRGALGQALSPPLPTGYLGQVVFITDGAVDYEDELVSLVRQRLGNRRLFTVGIGSAPNGFFMRKAAEIGGGTFTYIGHAAEVERHMARLFEKIANPVSTDLAVTFDGGILAEPIAMPRDLYAGEPLVLAARFSELPRAIVVSGVAKVAGVDPGGDGVGSRNDAGRWRIPVAASAAPDSGLHVLWARSRIEALSDEIRQARQAGSPQEELRSRVVQLALDHHLVSAYTSLVAVDLTPVRPEDAPLHHADVPANLPAGWDREALLGQAERLRSARAAAPGAAGFVADISPAPVLARTATPAPLQLAIGLVLLALGFLLLLSRRGSRLLGGGPSAGDRR